MKRLAVLDARAAPDNYLDCCESMCRDAGVACKILDCSHGDDVVAGASDCDAAICFWMKIDGNILGRLPRLRQMVRVGIGVDNFDLNDFTEHGVYACNTPDYGIEEVAVHTLALILALERNLLPYAQASRRSQWQTYVGREMRRISRRTLGIVGFGRVARRLVSLALPLGYEILAYDPYVHADTLSLHGVSGVPLQRLFSSADVLSVLAPATNETQHVVSRENLSLAKDGLLLVNTSRGSLVDTGAVVAGLASGKIGGAALDVLEIEPPGSEYAALMSNNSVIITPHVAYRSAESLEALNRMSVQTALDFLCDNKIANLVNTTLHHP